ncbi:LysM peptidoglycan-binding domain-containing protein [Roseibium denhamense]|uniref:Nucleoid-associated protein YgaU, contains BON and LysM domains n=1 Tax=Roseibium denhamense TaxID=76305 RepID=A0ABY1NV75_9HYPH|nr:LysM peptidoglycan-binding domain-containing protein [Roseibium denhamense]MTI05472.1 LysM peptidoglycan-binding domain-containing protein [Roseibium denhamense]SMP18409.1 Nucleoid-associated protein YgaU, contains BON and LysM domains [Roseibium denhamense]
MNKNTLTWALIAAVPIGLAALGIGYLYQGQGSVTPQQTQEASEEAGAATETAASAPETNQPADTTEDGGAVAEAASDAAGIADRIGPSFDVVGIEPTGETVVAGRSDAGAIVALTANGEVVGKSVANEAGEWTIILDQPLKPGDYDVGLEVQDDTGKALGTSEERVIVSLPEGGQEQPLVVLNTPDGPSDILQKPDTEDVTVAQADETPVTPEPESTDTASTAPETDVTATAEAPADAAGTETAMAAVAPAPDASQSAAGAEESGAAQTASATAPAGTDEPLADQSPTGATDNGSETQAVAAASQDQSGGDPAGTASQSATGVESGADANTLALAPDADAPVDDQPAEQAGVATAPDAQDQATSQETADAQAPAPATDAAPTVTVEAVESEQDKVFVAGTGEPGSSVRVYVGDDFQGEAQVGSTGKWLVEGDKNVAEGDVEVRADLIAEDGSSVDARAAVTFEKEQDEQIVLTKVVASGEASGSDAQAADVKKALPVVIIRKGDNLWRISRRLYGDGIRYTTIYQANQDQIRNPDLIYPGQVFLTPEGDLNWPQETGQDGQNG